jgi:predicted metal-binding membrane protein
MASLFALGIMSVTWMALVAGIIAIEKTVPWRGAVTYATAGLLLGLGLLLLIAPEALPGLTTPSGMTM